MEEKLIIAAINAGAGTLIAALIIYLSYRLAKSLLMDVGTKIANALQSQATSMESLTKSIQESVKRDDNEHREMLVLLKYIAQRHQSFEGVEREHNDRVRNGVHCKERDEEPE